MVVLGHALSRNVLPMAATNDALLSPRLRGGGCLTAITVYGLPGAGGIAVVQVRSAVAEGRERAFAEELAAFARDHGFAECACLAAADPIFLSAATSESARAFHMSTKGGSGIAARALAAGSQPLSAPGEGNPVSLAVAKESGSVGNGIGTGPGVAEELLAAFGEKAQVPLAVLFVLRTDEGSGGRVDDALALAEVAAAVFPGAASKVGDGEGEGVAAAAAAAGGAAGKQKSTASSTADAMRAGRWVLPPSFEALFGVSSVAPLQEDQGMLFA